MFAQKPESQGGTRQAAGPDFRVAEITTSSPLIRILSKPADFIPIKKPLILAPAREARFFLASVPSYRLPPGVAFPQEQDAASSTSASPPQAKKSNLKKWLLIAGAGAAAGIIIIATQSGSYSDSSNESGTSITVGPPTVGPPQ